jgi:hypothetical protein
MGDMSNYQTSSFETSYRVRLDSRRRPTLPTALLDEAGIDGEGVELIARADGPGRIVLENPLSLLREVQAAIAAEMVENNDTADLSMELIEQRQLDASRLQ